MALVVKTLLKFKFAPPLLYITRFASSHTSVKTADIGKMTQVLQPVIKSPLDNREYRALILSNKLKVICCSDSTTDKAAASLSVAAGSLNDPDNLPGLAHFCEHMLFLGTQKYPIENEYSKFLADNGGSSNAYTSRDQTNYYFDVAPEALEPALDRFSQFFITPLFTEAATEREINAVNSEHEKNIPVDAWRSYQLELTTSDLKHPYSRFATGSRKTLWETPKKNNVDTVAALKEFYHKFYSANVMSLAVIGKESLDDMQQLVEKMFCGVKNYNIDLPRWPENPYGVNELQKRISAVPVKDVRYLSILFPIPDFTHLYKASAEGYVSHLLGHEGEGSLMSLLKKQNWVNSLQAGSHVPARGFGTFKLGVELTPEGQIHVDDIVEHIFQYIKMLRSVGPQKWLWEEIRDVNAMIFRFKDKERPQSLVSYVTSVMHDYPLEDVLSAGYILTDFDEKLISSCLERLTPENCRITITSRDNESQCDQTEEWYGVKYKVDTILPDLIKKWENCQLHPELGLPPPNEFIPTVFDLKPRDDYSGIVPRILLNTPFSRVWFLQDSEFMLPKAVIRLEVHSHLPLLDPLNANLNHLMVAATKDRLTEISYAAQMAGLHYHIMETVYGHEVVVSGYDQKLGILLEMILLKLTKFSCKSDRFEVMKEQYTRALKNWKDDQPYSHATYFMSTLLREKRWTNQECMKALNDTTLPKLEAYAIEFYSKLKLEWLYFGNITASESLDLVNKCQSLYEATSAQPLLPGQAVRLREVELPQSSNYVFKSEHHSHSSSCAAVLFQTGIQSTRNNVIIELLDHIANEPCFNQLRTQEQLGYIVFTGVRRSQGSQGLQIIVQGERHPAYVESRIHNFIGTLNTMLHEMNEEEFLQHRTALRVRKAEKPKKLKDRAYIVWSEIGSQQYNFERQKVEIAALEEITLKDVVEFFEANVGPDATGRRRLAVHAISMKEGGAGMKVNEVESENTDSDYPGDQEVVEDITEWKTHLPLFPVPMPFQRIQNFVAAPSKSKL